MFKNCHLIRRWTPIRSLGDGVPIPRGPVVPTMAARAESEFPENFPRYFLSQSTVVSPRVCELPIGTNAHNALTNLARLTWPDGLPRVTV